MSRSGPIVAALLVSVAVAGCGVRSEGEPEILRTPPPPTATPSSTEQPKSTPGPAERPTATGSPTSTAPHRLPPSSSPSAGRP